MFFMKAQNYLQLLQMLKIPRKTVASMLAIRVEQHIVDMNQQFIYLMLLKISIIVPYMRQNFIKNHKIYSLRVEED